MSDPGDPELTSAARSASIDDLPRQVLDNLLEGCQVIDADFRYRYVNDAVAQHGRKTKDQLLGRTMMEAYPGIEDTEMFSVLRRCMAERSPQRMDNEFTFPDGSKGWFELRFEPVPDGVAILSVDVTKRRRAAAKVLHLNAVLRGIRKVNQLITRERNPQLLIQKACDLLVESRGIHSSCIVLCEGDQVVRMAAAGAELELRGLRDMLSEGELPDCIRCVLEDPRLIVRQPFAAACKSCPARDEYVTERDEAVLPLVTEDRTLGALLVSLPAGMGTDPEETGLLEEVAGDLAFALQSIELRTERDRSAEQLRAADEQLGAIVRAAPAAIFSLDEDGRVLTWNSGAESMFGWSASEVLGRLAPIVPDDKRQEHEALRRSVFGGESFTELELERVRKDGTRIWVSVSTAPLRDQDGATRGVMAVVLDISKRRQTEEALRHSEQRYRELVANVDDVVFSLDDRGHIEYLSAAVERVFGFQPDTVVGQHFSVLVHPDDLPGLTASFERTLAGAAEPYEFRGFDHEGRLRHLRSRSRARLVGGTPAGVDGVLVDFTDLRKAQDAGQEAQRQHATLLGNLPGMAYRCRFDSRWTMEILSEGCRALTGYPPEELIDNAERSYADVIHPDDRDRVWNEIQTAVGEGRRFELEYRIVTASGEDRWVWEKGAPVGSPTAEKFALEGLVTDITSRKRAEARARERNERLHRLARAVRDLSGARALESVAEVVRRAARDLVDADGATFVLRDGDLCHYVDEDAISPLWKGKKFPMSACISGWTMIHRQTVTISDIYQDERIPHDVYRPTFVKSLVMLPIRSDDPIGTIGSYWARPYEASADDVRILQALADSTSVALENIRVLRELEEGKERVRAIYDHLPNATFLWQHQGEGFVLTDFNVAARVATSGSMPRYIGKRPADLADAFPGLEQDLERCLEHREPARREVDCALPGGQGLRRLVLTYGFIPADMIILHTEDVTEQRQTEEQLKLSQRLEAVGRLAGGVAHDFNNLLTVINNYSGFALDELRESDPVRADLVEVQTAGRRAAALTRQLLAFSRRQILEPEVLSLNKVAADIQGMLRRLLGEDIDIAVRLADELGSVEADPGQMEQVLMNLAINARDAMPGGGKLTIETSNVELDEGYADGHVAVEPGQYVMLSVADTGSGMDAQTRERAFEPFFTTKDKEKGTGLGLSTVYGIVKQSNGNIWVYSEPGRGTTFKIYLPRVDAPATEVRRRPVSAMLTGTETVLVVEDEDAVRKLAERILTRAGYRALGASNGGEALLLSEKHGREIDLLLTDVVMPRMSGKQLAQRLSKLCPKLKTLYMSGYTDNAIVDHGVLDPGTRFISKPFSAADLTRKVREVLDA